MLDAKLIEWIRNKYKNLATELDERGRRRWAAVEAMSLGRGGIIAVANATGISDRTIRTGIQELNGPHPLASDRQRRSGGGRKEPRKNKLPLSFRQWVHFIIPLAVEFVANDHTFIEFLIGNLAAFFIARFI